MATTIKKNIKSVNITTVFDYEIKFKNGNIERHEDRFDGRISEGTFVRVVKTTYDDVKTVFVRSRYVEKNVTVKKYECTIDEFLSVAHEVAENEIDA